MTPKIEKQVNRVIQYMNNHPSNKNTYIQVNSMIMKLIKSSRKTDLSFSTRLYLANNQLLKFLYQRKYKRYRSYFQRFINNER